MSLYNVMFNVIVEMEQKDHDITHHPLFGHWCFGI